jgi:stage II sporulation protein D
VGPLARLVFLLAALAVALAGGLVPARHTRASAGQLVRVGILLAQPAVAVSLPAPATIGDPASQQAEVLPAGTYEFRPVTGGITGAGRSYGPIVRLQPTSGPLAVGPRAYRGVIELRRAGEGITVVNELDVEEYLYGVLKMEVDPRWPTETLKAQAVAARTLAFASLGRFAAEGYDLRATTDSQVYGGVNAEDPRTTAAVDVTRGVVATFGGRPIFAAYHADSGGMTEASELVWGVAYPYLRSVPDPWVEGSPVGQWLTRIDLPELEARLRRAGRPVSGVTGIEVAALSPSGRVLAVRVTGGHGTLELKGTELRMLVGVSVLRSTLFTVRLVPNDEVAAAEFQGRGSGHGVGLSQWGARGMGLAGRSYVEILQYYYRGVQVERRY